jgi:hypothetical protein
MKTITSSTVYPIEYSEAHSQSYFTFFVGTELNYYTISLYLNYIDSKSIFNFKLDNFSSFFIWDYFASGELYISLPPNKKIASAKNSFTKLYNKYFLDGPLSSPLPTSEIMNFFHEIAYCVTSPSDLSVTAWAFDLELLFNLEDCEQPTAAQKNPVCKYFSINSSNVIFKSEHYKFANLIENTSNCSSPQISSSDSISFCPQYIFNTPQTSCHYYSYDFTTVESTLIQPKNSSSTFTIDLIYANSLDSSHLFKIINTADSSEISSFHYPSDSLYEDILSEAISVYSNFIECYQDHDLSANVSKNQTIPETKLSYIQTLIG